MMKKILSIVVVSLLIVSPVYAEGHKKKTKVKFRGLKSVDTLNVNYTRFSPFNNEDNERHGHSIGLKARIRPWRIGKTDVGGYFSYSKGKGHTYKKSKDRWSHYQYEVMGGGLSALYNNSRNTETRLDLGLLHQHTEYWVPKKDFRSWQSEMQYDVNTGYKSENRRGKKKLLFPEWSVNFHYVHPFNVSYHDTKGREGSSYSYDNRRISLGGNLDIYDWYFVNDDNHWRITPTINANLGYLWGKESGYLQGGLGTKLAWYKEEMLDINFLNPRWVFEGNGSRRYDVMGTVKIDNLLRALWASQTKKYVSKKRRCKK